ncbi:hypothetical protein ACVIGA_004702 [Bradyrhizobium sp. USDA 3240]
MKSDPDLYGLFGAETEFSTWEQRTKQGLLPTREQLKAILRANAWLVSLACDKAKEHGYPHELWILVVDQRSVL